MQLHLDPVGGAAGDMVIAALLSAFPEHEAAVLESIRLAAPQVCCALVPHNDGILQGRRFKVDLHTPHDHDHGHDAAGHEHRQWRDIRSHLEQCGLAPEVLVHAVGVFTLLAEAEAQVHGVDVEAVSFHEVGAWDSIADIVGAAQLIAAIGAQAWSVGTLPLGAGRIRTAHGLMPVPAPATTLLMRGFEVIDDGVGGERVTPTGAAILRYLRTEPAPRARPRRLIGSGVGFGTRSLPGLSNCLRVLAFAPADARAASEHRELAVIEFEVDDQSAEDLALGLDRLRTHPAIFDVVQAPAFGKKGRMMTAVRLLARPAALDEVIAAVFRQTTTIGLRHHIVEGAALARTLETAQVEGHRLRVKISERPEGPTAKAEADDVLAYESHARRTALRRAAEDQALAGSRRRADEDVA
jgi:uncharacterized protein (TIGR00299 family) protein